MEVRCSLDKYGQSWRLAVFQNYMYRARGLLLILRVNRSGGSLYSRSICIELEVHCIPEVYYLYGAGGLPLTLRVNRSGDSLHSRSIYIELEVHC